MKYLCLIRAEKLMEQMPEADADRHYEEYREFTGEIRQSGHYVASDRLLPPADAITVRVRNGRISTTDGPYAETKEQLGGYFMIEARDLNEAIQVAAKIPGGRIGCARCGRSQRTRGHSPCSVTPPRNNKAGHATGCNPADRLFETVQSPYGVNDEVPVPGVSR